MLKAMSFLVRGDAVATVVDCSNISLVTSLFVVPGFF